ncbi:conserved protein, unknown function [Hepatocystis sp. ex Piliocolobus tephrosceles]|nr:conserved protein, unknown function [Hepatocystis sp. ex Piliocolobus tephrosceles]
MKKNNLKKKSTEKKEIEKDNKNNRETNSNINKKTNKDKSETIEYNLHDNSSETESYSYNNESSNEYNNTGMNNYMEENKMKNNKNTSSATINGIYNNDNKMGKKKITNDSNECNKREYDQDKYLTSSYTSETNIESVYINNNVEDMGVTTYYNRKNIDTNNNSGLDDNTSYYNETVQDETLPDETLQDEMLRDETLRDENEVSDISTDDILSNMSSDSSFMEGDEYVDNNNDEKRKEETHEYIPNNEIYLLSVDIKNKEKQLEEENKNIWKLKNRFNKLEKSIIIKKKNIENLKKNLDEKKKIEETESIICKNIKIQNNFLVNECKKLKEKKKKNQKNIIKVENDLNTYDNDIIDIKNKLMNKESELKEWAFIINKTQKEEYEIEKCKLSKDKEIKNLSYKLEKLNLEKVEEEKNLNIIKTKNLKLSIELDSLIKLNNDKKEEKKKLKENWQCVVDTIRSRDSTIFKFEGDFRKYINKKNNLKKKCEYMDTIVLVEKKKKNEDLNNKIKKFNVNLAKLRKEEISLEESYNQLVVEKDILIKSYDSEYLFWKEKVEETKNLKKLLNELNKTYDKLMERSNESKNELKLEALKKVTKNEYIKSVEKIINTEKDKLNGLFNDIKMLDEEKFVLAQNLQKSKNEYNILESNILGTEIKIKQMITKIKKLEKEIEKQKEIMYKFEFLTQVLTKKLNVITGTGIFKKKKENQKKIMSLKKELSQNEEIFNTLINDIKRINVELKNIKIYQNNLKEQNTNSTQKCNEIQLDIKALEHNLTVENKEKENIMLIELNLKLEFDKIKTTFEKHLTNLNMLKDENKTNIKNAKLNEQDMKAQLESYKIIIKNINEEIHKLNMLSVDKKTKCTNLETKLYNMNALQIDKDEIGKDENKTIYYKMKIEEDIIKLKTEILQLDNKIKKEESEKENYEKTLNDIIQTNKMFSDNVMQSIDPNYKILLKKKNKLEKKLNSINEQITILEKDINNYNEKMEHSEIQINQILLDSKNMEDKIVNIKENCNKMHNTLNDIFIKIERSSNQLKNLISNKKGKTSKVQKKNNIDASENEDDDTATASNSNNEQVSLEKKIFKQIQTESLKDKLSLLLECFKDYGDNTIIKETLHIIETA